MSNSQVTEASKAGESAAVVGVYLREAHKVCKEIDVVPTEAILVAFINAAGGHRQLSMQLDKN